MSKPCDCCRRSVPELDGLYGVCHLCAIEHSLNAFPCDHGQPVNIEALREAAGVVRDVAKGCPYNDFLERAATRLEALARQAEEPVPP